MCICVCIWYVRTNPERDILNEDKAALLEYNNSDDKSKVKTIKQHQDWFDTYDASGMAHLHRYNRFCEYSKSSVVDPRGGIGLSGIANHPGWYYRNTHSRRQ